MSKHDYLNLAQKIVEPVLKHYNVANSSVVFPHSFATERLTPEEVAFESFARPLWAATYLVKEGDKELGERILRMITNGTNPSSPLYWGDFIDYDHKLVDLPAISLFLYENEDLVRGYYSEEEKRQVISWLLMANQAKAWENNWLFFAILNNAFLLNAGFDGSRKVVEDNWKTLDSHYLSDGWYSDGKGRQRDYYIAFGYHFYSLVWLSVDKDISPDIRDVITERAESFARSFQLFFDDNGEAVPFGRSLIYRFAQVAFWSAYARAGLSGVAPSIVKGIINRNIRWWLSKDIFDESGILSIGYAYANTNISEVYSGSGSPYWACKIFVLLGLSDNATFWKQGEERSKLPSEKLCVHDAGMLLSKRQGIANLFPINQIVPFRLMNKTAKFEKIAYSTRTGICLSREDGSTIPGIGIDGTFAISADGNSWTVRNSAKSEFVDDEAIRSIWTIDPQTSIETHVTIHQGWHIRTHTVNSEGELWIADGGYAAPGKSVNHQSKDKAITIQGDDFYSVALCMTSGSAQLCQVEENLNSLSPKCSVPYILSQVQPGENIIVNAFYIGANPPEAEPTITKKSERMQISFPGKTLDVI